MNQSPADLRSVKAEPWVPNAPSLVEHPHQTDDFARVYEETAHRLTRPVALTALERVGEIGPGVHVLDIAAGAGALAIPAAEKGAVVMAIDNAPGMVRRLSGKLAAFSGCEARQMDGEALDFADGSFDAAFSMIGASLFKDWRRGLREQARVLRSGGKGCVASWRRPPGGGPFLVMAQALKSVFPDLAPPPFPEGFVALAEPEGMADALRGAGFVDVVVEEIEAVWEGPAGEAYLEEVKELHRFMGPYAALSSDDRRRVDAAVLSVVDAAASNGRVSFQSPVTLAVGMKR